MSRAEAEIWRVVSEEFGRLRGGRARQRWLDSARPASLCRGLFTLDVNTSAAKTAIDARYRTDLEELFRLVTGSPVRLRTRVVSAPVRQPEPEPDLLGDLPASVAAPRPVAFAVTQANRLAYAAVDRFVRGGSRAFNPLFIHGPAGSGKTELAALALRRLRAASGVAAPLALSAEALTRDVVRALRQGALPELQGRWRAADLVVLDEAHRLAGQRRSQREAARLIDPVLAAGGRVLVLSRHAPHEIRALDPKLHSLFAGGMAVSLGEPDVDDREAVLGAWVPAVSAPVDEDVVLLLARRCPGSQGRAVRLLQLLAEEASEEGRSVSAEAVVRRLGKAAHSDALEALVVHVSKITGVAVARIRSAEKSRDAAAARHLCVDVATRSLGWSTRRVCRYLGLRSPSVVAYARRAVARRRASDPGFDRLVHQVQAHLAGAQRDLAW